MSDRFEKLHKKIIEIISHSPVEEDPGHSEQVREFVLKIDPKASEELQIAALCHDIERGVAPRIEQNKGESYEDYKARHAKRSVDITASLMEELNYPKSTISRVCKLIRKHEIGGYSQADILKDADSASYFAYNIKPYLRRNGIERTNEKIKYMYNRASVRAKNIIKRTKYPNDVQKLINQVIT